MILCHQLPVLGSTCQEQSVGQGESSCTPPKVPETHASSLHYIAGQLLVYLGASGGGAQEEHRIWVRTPEATPNAEKSLSPTRSIPDSLHVLTASNVRQLPQPRQPNKCCSSFREHPIAKPAFGGPLTCGQVKFPGGQAKDPHPKMHLGKQLPYSVVGKF